MMTSPKAGSVTMFVDCVSPYSWFGFTNAVRFRPLLEAHDISVTINPFFLGAARNGVGNPWTPTPQAKEAFGTQDTEITGRLLGLKVVTPKVFPINSLFPVRIATWVKDNQPSKFEEVFSALASGYWSKGIDISLPEGVLEAFRDIFPPSETQDLIKKALGAENKQRVIEVTKSATAAFGAPWIMCTNARGEERSWFGNDRWNQVFEFLEVPYNEVRVLAPAKAKAKL